MILPKFHYLRPKSLDEVLALLSRGEKGARLLAGGTDILVKMKQGLINPDCLISLRDIPELNFIRYDKMRGLRIGSMTSLTTIMESLLIKRYAPALCEAMRSMSSVQIRNLATIGGNLCNASPANDSAPILIAMGARVRIVGAKGKRTAPLEDFFTGPGATVLKPDEVLTEIHIPNQPPETGGAYLKYGLRKASAIAVVGAAAVVTLEDGRCKDVRVALGAVAPTPIRARRAEAVLRGEGLEEELINRVAELSAEEARPITDVRGAEWYRRELVRVLIKRAIRRAAERCIS